MVKKVADTKGQTIKGGQHILLDKLHAETHWLAYFLILKMLVLRAQTELSAEMLSEWL